MSNAQCPKPSAFVSWFLFFDKEDAVLALPSWAAPRILIASRSLRQRWRDSSAFYPAFRFRARLVKLVVRTSATFFPKLFLRQRRKDAGGTKYRLAKFLNHTFLSFKQSSVAYSLFSDYFISTGILSADEYVDCDDRRGRLTDLIHGWFPQTDRVVLMTGAASDPKQKLVAKLVDQSGSMVGFVKFGEKPLARQRIETEAEILQSLPAGCGPRFQGMGKTKDHSCFAMSAVDGKMPKAKLPEEGAGRWALGEIFKYLERLKVSDEEYEIDNHPAILRLRRQLANSELDMPSAQRPVPSALQFEQWLVPLRERAWPLVIQHGDFTPWNVIRRKADSDKCRVASSALGEVVNDGVTACLKPKAQGLRPNLLCAIDWEEGTTSGFPYFDLIYYILQTAYFMHHWSAVQAFDYTERALGGNLISKAQSLKPKVMDSLIRLAALDAWFAGERGGLSGNPLQQFRLSIISLTPDAPICSPPNAQRPMPNP